MRFFGSASTLCALWAFSVITYSSAAALERRTDVICATSEQNCTSSSGSFCCPVKMECGYIKNQCFNSGTSSRISKSVVASGTPTLLLVARDDTATSSTAATSSASAASTSNDNFVTKVKSFFTTNVIIIFAASGGGALLFLTLVCCFCHRKRKQGRALLAAYENPERKPYESIIFAPGKGPSVSTTSIPQDQLKETETKEILPPPSAVSAKHIQSPLSPQTKYFDLYSPDSPAFQMTPQAPAGPLEHNGNGGGFQYPPAYQYPQIQEPQYPEMQDPHQQPSQYPAPRGHEDHYTEHPDMLRHEYFEQAPVPLRDSFAGSAYVPPGPQVPPEIYCPSPTYQQRDELPPPRFQTPTPHTPPQLQSPWSTPHHTRTLTPPRQQFQFTTGQASPPRPPRGPDVYLPAEMSGQYQNDMPHAL